MAYTTPTTRITGDVITSANWNTDLVDNIKWLATDKPMVRVHNNGVGQTISTGQWTSSALTHSTELFDNSNLHSTSTNTDRITVASTGKYLFGAYIQGNTYGSGAYMSGVGLYADATTWLARQIGWAESTLVYHYLSVSGLYELSASSYVTVIPMQETGANLSMYSLGFWALWIGT